MEQVLRRYQIYELAVPFGHASPYQRELDDAENLAIVDQHFTRFLGTFGGSWYRGSIAEYVVLVNDEYGLVRTMRNVEAHEDGEQRED